MYVLECEATEHEEANLSPNPNFRQSWHEETKVYPNPIPNLP